MTEQRAMPPAVDRKVLSEGVVNIRVAKSAERSGVKTETGFVRYLRFAQSFKGGKVPIYLHGADVSVVGKLIRARYTLYARTCADGTSDVHVDLRPTQEEATHRIFFLCDCDLHRTSPAWARFPTPQAEKGFVVVAPHDAKLKED